MKVNIRYRSIINKKGENMEIISVPVIVSLVYSVMEVYKKVMERHSLYEKYIRLIPLLSAILGITAGIICYFVFPEIMAAKDIYTAILIGGASGLSATGCHQIFKQLSKDES